MNKQTNKTHECLLFTEWLAHRNDLIDLNNLLSSFVKLVVIKSLKSFAEVLAFNCVFQNKVIRHFLCFDTIRFLPESGTAVKKTA